MRWGDRFTVAMIALSIVACTGSDTLQEGERGTEEFAVVVPEDWTTPDDRAAELFELVVDPPDQDLTARLGVNRVEGLNDARAYVMDTSDLGAGLRGLEPDLVRNEEFEVDGTLEARLVELTYTAAVDGSPRVHTLQLVVRRDDDVGFDLRIEALEEQWDEVSEAARAAVDSFRLRGR